MKYFLVEYKRPTGDYRITEFDDADRDRALAEACQREATETPDTEIVLLYADSETDIRRTHSRYFKSVRELIQGEAPSSSDKRPSEPAHEIASAAP